MLKNTPTDAHSPPPQIGPIRGASRWEASVPRRARVRSSALAKRRKVVDNLKLVSTNGWNGVETRKVRI
jgi:hypothetical protein